MGDFVMSRNLEKNDLIAQAAPGAPKAQQHEPGQAAGYPQAQGPGMLGEMRPGMQ